MPFVFLQRQDLNPRGSERKENNSANCFQRGAVRRVLLRSNGRRAISMQGEAVADVKSPMLHQKNRRHIFVPFVFLQRQDLNPRGSERKENNSANCFQRGAVRRVLLRSNGRRAISMQGEAAADVKSPMLHQKTEGTFLCLLFFLQRQDLNPRGSEE